MRMRGLEPPRPERHTDLNRARLPIPPHPRADDSSRHHECWHAARKPPAPFGVTSTMTRLPRHLTVTALCFVGAALCLLAAACGGRPAAVEGPMTEVIVTLRSPALAGSTGSAGDQARMRVEAEQGRFAEALHSTIPSSRIRWRYEVVLNGAAVVVPNDA